MSAFVNENRRRLQAAHDALDAHRAETDALLKRQPTEVEAGVWTAHAEKGRALEWDVIFASRCLIDSMRIEEEVNARMERERIAWETSKAQEVRS